MTRWTDQAIADLAGHVAWLHERNPAAAIAVGEDVLEAIETLATFPHGGRPDRHP